ncbi:MAG: ferritin [Ardenticatenaceae bacterium]
MLDEALQEALNNQINLEFESMYAYLSMAAHFEGVNLQGFARWMRFQSEEEQAHAMRLFDYVLERDGRVVLQAIKQPSAEFGSPIEVFRQALAHEQKVSRAIHDLYALAASESDYAAQAMLQWFIEEQVEEEDTARTIVAHLEMIGDDKAALFLLDRELGARRDAPEGA